MSAESIPKIRPKDREVILQSLRAGVTPKAGLQHIKVGRVKEVLALIEDMDRVLDGGSAFRLIIGDFGAGKTFFLQLIRMIALEKGLVTMTADLSPDRRIHATGGQARSLYTELTRNMATRSKPEGNALTSVVERFITEARKKAETKGNTVENVIADSLKELSELVGGYDFAKVIEAYWKGHETGNDQLSSDAVRWLRGEFATKTDARQALGVRAIVDDSNVYDQLKLMALFVKQAGYGGLIVNLDEMVNLYKLSNTQARRSNYEKILQMLNDCLQGNAQNLGFLLGGTPDFLKDPRKGLYSYEALHSRLAENTFAQSAGVIDYSSPAIHLAPLRPEDIYLLLENIRNIFASGDSQKFLVPDEGLRAFLAHCSKTIGDAYFRTPRNTIKAFLHLLAVLDQDKAIQWPDLIGGIKLESEINSDLPPIGDSEEDEDKLSTLKL